jgi:acetoacetyl-CoA synthetase
LNPILWQPSPEQIEAANMTAFRRFAGQRWQADFADYAALYRWSVERPDQFWQSVWEYCHVIASCPAETTVDHFERMPGAHWFPGAKLNFAENLLRYSDERRALVFWNEAGFQRSLTYAELYDQTARLAAALHNRGVTAGDRVASFLPNIPEAVVAMLATASLGAVWSSCSPDFGLSGLVDRFGQIEPKVLFTADGYIYNGKRFNSLERVQAAKQQIPSIEYVIVVPQLESRLQPAKAGTPTILWPELLAESPKVELAFEQLPFDHPLYVLFSSGTTGPPKCIVHSAGGILLQHLKELVLHCDLKRDDRIFFFTTCGWMMWNWLVSSLAVGSEVILYDGSPLAREGRILFDMAEQERITVFGTSPRFLTAAEKSGLTPRATHNLESLTSILSTGSPLSGESFDYVYQQIKPDARLSSISGGTDLCSCFALGNPVGPVYRGELQTRGLGMKVAVYNDAGQSIVGEKGELVCEAPFPSMPLGFWRDSDGSAYRHAYFERFPGVWHHGDYAELTEHGGLIIYGRSDAVLNPGGVRIGTAEIYRQVEQLSEVLECVVIGQDWLGDVRVVLFVKLREGVNLDQPLIARIKNQIRQHTTPRHVPAVVLAVSDIPRTKSGKIVELAVREAVHGREVKNVAALANPESLAQFQGRAELS